MTNARNIVQDAFEAMQVYAPGEAASSADMARGFNSLNKMLDSWSNETLTCYANLEQNATLIPGQYQYTIGSGGNFNMTRPLTIIDSPGTAYVVDPNGNRYNLEVVTQDKWNLIWNITETSSNYPNTLFYDPQYPLGIINVFPVPTIGWQLYWDSRLQLGNLSSLASAFSLPPGYEKAITENLAIDLSMYYPTAKITPQLMKSAAQSKGNIKRTNVKPTYLYYDPEIVGKAQGSYNVYSDSSRAGGVQ